MVITNPEFPSITKIQVFEKKCPPGFVGVCGISLMFIVDLWYKYDNSEFTGLLL